ncbi:MAG TPA: hypothetical protein VJP77_06290, partial [Planctomycetota bacterium]|nr:hypothetical protein [Planctomycetota bacterium]
AGERELARESLERVVAADPEGPWGTRAAELLAGRSFEERSWASLQAGLEYDSNVVLLGEAVPTPLGISDRADGRAVWFLEGGVELFRTHRWSGGVAASYAGNVQFELEDFDIQYPRASAWLDFDVNPDNLLRLRYGGGHAWVDYTSFLWSQDATLSGFHNWGTAGNTELGLGWLWNDYTFFIVPVPNGAGPPGSPCAAGLGILPCAPPGVNSQAARNRDGNSLRPFLLHRYRVRSIDGEALRDVELRAGYGFERYWAEGTDWDYSGHDFVIGAEALLLFGIELDSQLGFSYRPFTYPSSYPAPPTPANVVYALSPVPREDRVTIVGVSLEKPLDEHWSVSTRYFYTRSDSTVVVFDYARHVVGAYLKYEF